MCRLVVGNWQCQSLQLELLPTNIWIYIHIYIYVCMYIIELYTLKRLCIDTCKQVWCEWICSPVTKVVIPAACANFIVAATVVAVIVQTIAWYPISHLVLKVEISEKNKRWAFNTLLVVHGFLTIIPYNSPPHWTFSSDKLPLLRCLDAIKGKSRVEHLIALPSSPANDKFSISSACNPARKTPFFIAIVAGITP